MGFTCLIQLSTPDKDYILDALVLRGHLHLLNQAFTHPGILKVLSAQSFDFFFFPCTCLVLKIGAFVFIPPLTKSPEALFFWFVCPAVRTSVRDRFSLPR